MAKIKLLVEFPGVPAGNVMIADADGVYQDGLNRFRLSQAWVDANPDKCDIIEDVISGTTEYWFINDTGVVQSKTFQNTLADKAHRLFGNYFRTQELAQAARNKLIPIYRDSNHGFADSGT